MIWASGQAAGGGGGMTDLWLGGVACLNLAVAAGVSSRWLAIVNAAWGGLLIGRVLWRRCP